MRPGCKRPLGASGRDGRARPVALGRGIILAAGGAAVEDAQMEVYRRGGRRFAPRGRRVCSVSRWSWPPRSPSAPPTASKRCRRRVGSPEVARPPGPRPPRGDTRRPRSGGDGSATRRDAQAARSRRAGRRGAGGLRSGFARLPPLPDAVHSSRSTSGRPRPPIAQVTSALRAGGPDRGDTLGDRAVAARLGHGGPGPVGLLHPDLEVPPVLGQDRVRQHVGARGASLGGTADRRHPRARHAQPAAALDERSGSQHGRVRIPKRALGGAGAGPGAALADAGPPAPTASARSRAARVRSMPPIWRRRTRSTRSTRRATTGRAATVALLEMSGAGYSSSDISTFASCYGITLGNGQITRRSRSDGGGATGSGTAEAELDIETVLSLAPKANIEVYEGGASDSLYDVFSQIVSDDTAKIVSASWTNGCEAYVGQSIQNSENTLFQAAAAEGQSIFVASGGSGVRGLQHQRGDRLRRRAPIPWRRPSTPRQAPSTSPTKSATRSAWTAREARATRRTSRPPGSVSTGTGPDAIALDASAGKVFVANVGSTLTVFPTAPATRSTTSGCGAPTQIPSGGHLSAPAALAVSGSTLYVGNSNGTVAIYNATTNAYVTTVTLPSSSVPTALAVDATNGFVYVADGTNSRIEYFNADDVQRDHDSRDARPRRRPSSVGNDPVALAVASGAGDLYVANAGQRGRDLRREPEHPCGGQRPFRPANPPTGRAWSSPSACRRTTTRSSPCSTA